MLLTEAVDLKRTLKIFDVNIDRANLIFTEVIFLTLNFFFLSSGGKCFHSLQEMNIY